MGFGRQLVVPERAPKLGDGDLDDLPAAGGRIAPEPRHEIIRSHGAVGVQQQVREEAALPGAAEPERKAIPPHLERAE